MDRNINNMNDNARLEKNTSNKIKQSHKILSVPVQSKNKYKKHKKNYKRKFGKELQNQKKQKKIYIEKYKEQISTASSFEDNCEPKNKNNLTIAPQKIQKNIMTPNKINSFQKLTSCHWDQNNTSCGAFLETTTNLESSLSEISEIQSEKRNINKKRVCPQLVKDYSTRINQFLIFKDPTNKLSKNFMSQQSEITASMRSKLIDWLVDVSFKFKILDETLFAAIWYLDKYMNTLAQVKKHQFQLIGITCLMIASKLEEVYPPCLTDFEKVCDGAYTVKNITECEAEIMIKLNFNLAFHSSLLFYKTECQELGIEGKPFYYGEFLLTNALLDESVSEYSQNTLSDAACFLLNKMFKLNLTINEKENISEIKTAAKNLYKFIKKTEKLNLTAVKRKFAKADKLEVSKFKVERVNKSK
jgi:hypothetical protein